QALINQIKDAGLELEPERVDIKNGKLDLSNLTETVSTSHLRIIFTALEYNTANLKQLDLSKNDLIADLIMELFDALIANETLKVLNLSSNIAGNDALKHIASVLKVNNTLQKLELSDNIIGEAGGADITQAIANLNEKEHFEYDLTGTFYDNHQ